MTAPRNAATLVAAIALALPISAHAASSVAAVFITKPNDALVAELTLASTVGPTDAALTSATLRRIVEVRFDAPPVDALPLLLTRVDRYDPTIAEVRFDHAHSATPGAMGVGSVRICVFTDGRELHEPIIAYDPPHRYAYTVDADASTMALPVSDIALIYDFAPDASGGTHLTVRAHFDPAVPGTGAIIEPVLTGTLRRTFQTAVATFGGTYLGDRRP